MPKCTILSLLLGLLIHAELWSTNSQAQPFSINYTVEDGLPSNEVYDLETDQYGKLWICTDNGIACFDGKEFKTFKSAEYSPVILGSEKDPYGTIWFFTVKGEILKLTNNQPELIVPHQFIDTLLKGKVFQDLKFINNELWLTGGQVYVRIREYLTPQPIVEKVKTTPGWIQLKTIDGQPIGIIGSLSRNDNGPLGRGLILEDDTIASLLPGPLSYTNFCSVHQFRDQWLVTTQKWIGLFNSNDPHVSGIKPVPDLLHPRIHFIDNSYWIGTQTNGVINYTVENGLMQVKHYFQGVGISNVFKDKFGSYWFASHERGLFYMPQDQLHSFNQQFFSDELKWVVKIGNVVVRMTDRGKVYKYFMREGILSDTFMYDFGAKITKYRNMGNGSTIVFGRENDLVELNLNTGETKSRSNEIKEAVLKHLFKSSLSRTSLLIFHPEDLEHPIHSQSPWTSGRIRNYDWIEGREVYFGNFYGTFHLDTALKLCHELKSEGNSLDFRKALLFHGDTCLIGTKGGGLILAENGRYVRRLFPNQVNLDIIHDIKKLDDGFWIATPSKLFHYQPEAEEQLKDWTFLFSKTDLSITALEILDGHVLVFTSSGIFSFLPDNIVLRPQGPDIHSALITYGDTTRSFESGLKLSPDHASFEVEPQCVSFDNAFKMKYRYRLRPVQEDWIVTSESIIRFNALESGNYQLEMCASNAEGNYSVQPYQVAFTVQPRFYRTTIFWIVMATGALTLLALFYQYRLNQIKKRTALEVHIAEAKSQALSSQLNPHFVFNSMNSVISFVADNDAKSALRFLGKFAKMMRNVFNNSMTPYISIEKELSAIDQYCEIESVRLGNEFSWSFEVDPAIDQLKVCIPSLILQPFVENAIWHGIAKLNGQGRIKIAVDATPGNYLEITISDNGPGHRPESMDKGLPRKNQRSSALIRDRFQILQQMSGKEHSVKYLDSVQNGTTVKIRLPFRQSHQHDKQ